MTVFRGTVGLWCLLATSLAAFQRPAGQVQIEVRDPSGAAVSASGRLESLSAGTVQRFEADAQGMHTFTRLPLGRYRLEVARAGFAASVTTLDLRSAAPMTTTIHLALSGQTVQVDVVGAT